MKYIRILLIIIVFGTHCACTDWLSVSPDTLVESDKLLSDEEGYYNAMHGLYSKMSETGLYGTQLSMRFTDVLAQYYKFSENEEYYDIVMYDFTEESAKKIIEQIWSDAYNVIVNSNNLIDNLQAGQSPLRENVNNYILAQSLGLRGLMHFDLLRLFHVPYGLNKEFVSMPYVTEVSKDASLGLNSEKIVNNVLNDLLAAHNHLEKCDPFYNDNSTEGFERIVEKRFYLNYYSVSALLARVYLYMGNYTEALIYANIVLEEGGYRFVNQDEIQANTDFLFENEVLFGFHFPNIHDYTYGKSPINGVFAPTSTNLRGYTLDELSSELYFASSDLRYSNWFIEAGSGGMQYSVVKKYYKESVTSDETETYYSLEVVPTIKYGEVVLIAAEAKARLNTVEEGMVELNSMQRARLGYEASATSLEDFLEEIKMEYRREFYGEGQTFYAYKRLLSQVIDFTGSEVELNESNYFIPLPDDEVLFGGR